MMRAPTLAGGLVVLAAVGAYAATIDNYFAQDDFGVVWLLSQKSIGNVPEWFVSTWMDDIWGYTPDEIRPFPAMTYVVASWFGPGSPVANHVMNIAMHGGTAVLLLALARVAGIGLIGATAGALVFVLLPNQVESVAWVTGRVDSMPAFIYIASLLAYARWRAGASTVALSPARTYVLSVALCFIGLFSKQNVITLGPAIVLYDLLVAGRPLPLSRGRRSIGTVWAWMRPYLPFALLTAGYLALRYVLFNQVVREQMLTPQGLEFSRWAIGQHVLRIVLGDVSLARHLVPWMAGALALLALASIAVALLRRLATHPARGLVYFGIVWTAINLAPSLVAGYISPRHAYLASAGWAMTVALLADLLWRANLRAARVAGGLAVTVLLGVYIVELRGVLTLWEEQSAVSARAVADVEREAMAAPPGSLIVAGVPALSWAWALPFATRPPFTRTDLFDRVSVIGTAPLHCCGTEQWEPYTRSIVSAWLARPDRAPVIAMHWDRHTGTLARVSEADDPSLRTLMRQVLDTKDGAALDATLTRVLSEYVALRQGS